MPTLPLHDCKRLRARITLAACEANRAKPATPDAKDEYIGAGMRPWACNTCSDWQSWNSENAMEVTVSNPQPEAATPVCSECSGDTQPFTRGLCRKCYQRQRRREKKAQQTDAFVSFASTASVALVESPAQPAPVATEQQIAEPPVLASASASTTRRIYLACPYTSTDAAVMAQRLASATTAANALIRQGHNVFSPISHGAEVGKGLPPDFAFWGTSCLSFVEHWATDVFVLMLPGWETSVGVLAEVEAAKALNIPVTHILPMPCHHDLPLAV